MTDGYTAEDHATGGTDGRVAVITGAGQGIGASFARHLSARGYRVALIDRNLELATAVAASLTGPSIVCQADISNEEDVAAARDRTLERFGSVDSLINCAAIFSTIEMKGYELISAAEWDQVMAVNVRGTFLCCRDFAAPMREAGYGRIVNISSGTIYMGRPLYLHYVTSKAAIVGLTRALSRELGAYDITVNAIAPGSTQTEVDRGTDYDADSIVAKQSIKRRETPLDLLSALDFLIGPTSGFVTGQTVVVDGGVSFV